MAENFQDYTRAKLTEIAAATPDPTTLRIIIDELNTRLGAAIRANNEGQQREQVRHSMQDDFIDKLIAALKD